MALGDASRESDYSILEDDMIAVDSTITHNHNYPPPEKPSAGANLLKVGLAAALAASGLGAGGAVGMVAYDMLSKYLSKPTPGVPALPDPAQDSGIPSVPITSFIEMGRE